MALVGFGVPIFNTSVSYIISSLSLSLFSQFITAPPRGSIVLLFFFSFFFQNQVSFLNGPSY